MVDKKPRNTRPLTMGEAIDKLVAVDRDAAMEFCAAHDATALRLAKRKAANLERVPAEILQQVTAAVEAVRPEEDDGGGGFGGFGTDPKDSAALLELRQIIDDEIGWPTFEQEEIANYGDRLRALAMQRNLIARAWEDQGLRGGIASHLVQLLDELHAQSLNLHPDPVASDGARAVEDSDLTAAELLESRDRASVSEEESERLPRGARPYEPGPAARNASR